MQTRLILLFAGLILIGFLFPACQDDPETSAAPADPEFPEVGLVVRNMNGDKLKGVKIYETKATGRGTVYQFLNGDGNVPFGDNYAYKIRVEGYEDLSFTLPQVDGLRRIVAYLNEFSDPEASKVCMGEIRDYYWRPLEGARITYLDAPAQSTGLDGIFQFTDVAPEGRGNATLACSWLGTDSTEQSLEVVFDGPVPDSLRMDLYIDLELDYYEKSMDAKRAEQEAAGEIQE